jgi:GBP family porin
VKEKLFIMAALLGGSGFVHAQSSVTLYGIVNEAITYSSNQGGHSAVQLTGNGEYGSRWGLRGAEDLGGGTKAIFTLADDDVQRRVGRRDVFASVRQRQYRRLSARQ